MNKTVTVSEPTDLLSSVCLVGSAFIVSVLVCQEAKTKAKLGAFTTDINAIQSFKISALLFSLFCCVYFGNLRHAKAEFSQQWSDSLKSI